MDIRFSRIEVHHRLMAIMNSTIPIECSLAIVGLVPPAKPSFTGHAYPLPPNRP